MGGLSPYFDDNTLIMSLRKYYPENEQYNVNFKYWLSTAHKVKDGMILNIAGRKFLIDYYTGSVLKEVK